MPEAIVGIGASERGRRANNEDAVAVLVDPQGPSLRALAVVADGMGGHNAGEVAAAITVAACRQAFEGINREAPLGFSIDRARDFLHALVSRINEEILWRAAKDPLCAGMGTTIVVAAVLPDDQALVMHIGDSRAYLARRGSFKQLTRDHSALAERLDRADDEESEWLSRNGNNLYAHALTRSLGQEDSVEPSFSDPIRLLPGDTLVLVTDGITDVLESHALLSLHESSSSLESFGRRLIREALFRGSTDNVTVAALAVGSSHKLFALEAPAPETKLKRDRVFRRRIRERLVTGLYPNYRRVISVVVRSGLAVGLLLIGIVVGKMVWESAGSRTIARPASEAPPLLDTSNRGEVEGQDQVRVTPRMPAPVTDSLAVGKTGESNLAPTPGRREGAAAPLDRLGSGDAPGKAPLAQQAAGLKGAEATIQRADRHTVIPVPEDTPPMPRAALTETQAMETVTQPPPNPLSTETGGSELSKLLEADVVPPEGRAGVQIRHAELVRPYLRVVDYQTEKRQWVFTLESNIPISFIEVTVANNSESFTVVPEENASGPGSGLSDIFKTYTLRVPFTRADESRPKRSEISVRFTVAGYDFYQKAKRGSR